MLNRGGGIMMDRGAAVDQARRDRSGGIDHGAPFRPHRAYGATLLVV
jgi:hypothetical protein